MSLVDYMPYWLWRVFSLGMKDHMRENSPIRVLAAMAMYTGSLDRKGLYVQRLAQELLREYQLEGI